jgi:hypothetical protein
MLHGPNSVTSLYDRYNSRRLVIEDIPSSSCRPHRAIHSTRKLSKLEPRSLKIKKELSSVHGDITSNFVDNRIFTCSSISLDQRETVVLLIHVARWEMPFQVISLGLDTTFVETCGRVIRTFGPGSLYLHMLTSAAQLVCNLVDMFMIYCPLIVAFGL